MDVLTKNFYRQVLKDELQTRVLKNDSYSLRAFARDLEVSPSYLSEVLSGKKSFKTEYAAKVSKKINLSPTQEELFIKSAEFESEGNLGITPLDEKQIGEMSNPDLFAFLNLFYLNDYQNNIDWMAQKLNINQNYCLELLETLINLKLIEKRDEKYFRTSESISIPHHSHPSFQKEFHSKTLDSFNKSIHLSKAKELQLHHMSLAINPDKILPAQKKIDKFLDEMEEFLETGEQTELYQFNVYLAPYFSSKF